MESDSFFAQRGSRTAKATVVKQSDQGTLIVTLKVILTVRIIRLAFITVVHSRSTGQFWSNVQ